LVKCYNRFWQDQLKLEIQAGSNVAFLLDNEKDLFRIEFSSIHLKYLFKTDSLDKFSFQILFHLDLLDLSMIISKSRMLLFQD
jgi:hypothetical protein